MSLELYDSDLDNGNQDTSKVHKEELIEYTLNGKKNIYLVKNEVDAFIVDSSENW